ncbi:helix-turn-helix domain-containing protein [Rhodococcoides corynebacterioides]|uniref:helix-turn-helix domain-containing protein n=1 Tax=Rhodococcoides corynebacterioides TaxID=53972 RepID=UPI003F7EE95D
MRMKLIARDALDERMIRKGWSNRRLAKYAECAPGTIDNLIVGRTQAVNNPRTAELICEALDVPLDVFFVPEISSSTSRSAQQGKVPA